MDGVKATGRMANFDMLRNISMLMIVIIHALTHGRILDNLIPATFEYYVIYTLYGLTMTSVNCYVLISGYFMYSSDKKYSLLLKKVIALIVKTFFYSVGIYLLLFAFGICDSPRYGFFNMVTPVIHRQYWFITIYIGMYLITPFLNIGIRAMEKKAHIQCICIMAILYSFIPTFFHVKGWLGSEEGYSVSWFILLYLISSYIKKYNENISMKKKVLAYVGSILLLPFSKMAVLTLSGLPYLNSLDNNCFVKDSDIFYAFASPPVLIASVAIFLIFKSVSVRKESLSRLMIKIAPHTLAVYLIHNHQDIKSFLWNTTNIERQMHKPFLILYLVFVCIVIFSCCVVTDFILKFIFIKLSGITKKIYGKYSRPNAD